MSQLFLFQLFRALCQDGSGATLGEQFGSAGDCQTSSAAVATAGSVVRGLLHTGRSRVKVLACEATEPLRSLSLELEDKLGRGNKGFLFSFICCQVF